MYMYLGKAHKEYKGSAIKTQETKGAHIDIGNL